MKKIKYLLISILCIIVFPISAHAASASIGVSATSKVVVGNKVTVTVSLSSSTAMGSWEMLLNYDKNYLQLTSSTAEGGGVKMAGYTPTASGVKKKTYTFTFKTLKTGSTNVSVGSYLVYANDDMSQMSTSAGSASIKIITQAELEASYSKVNDLSSLSVEGAELTPTFSKDTLEYNTVVPEDTKEINIVAKASDSKASISGAGTHEVTSGVNTFEIVVRAENGSEKTYKINVEVKDNNPINVTVNNEEFTVVKIRENLPGAEAYQDYTLTIDGMEVPAYKNENTGIVLVGLKASDGNISLYTYDEEGQNYQAYYEIGVNKVAIYPIDTGKVLDGYTKGEVEINGEVIQAYYYDKSSRFVIIYGINVETGEEGFYLYDKENQSVVKYNDEYIVDLQEKINLYSYIILGFSGIFIIIILIFIVVMVKKNKKKKNKPKVTTVTFDDEEKVENNKVNEIVELEKNSEIKEKEIQKQKKKKR